ncbi:unnamed protein product, partial [Ascophyllum nodosum]
LQHRRNSWRKCWHVEGGLRVPNSGIRCYGPLLHLLSSGLVSCPLFSGGTCNDRSSQTLTLNEQTISSSTTAVYQEIPYSMG